MQNNSDLHSRKIKIKTKLLRAITLDSTGLHTSPIFCSVHKRHSFASGIDPAARASDQRQRRLTSRASSRLTRGIAETNARSNRNHQPFEFRRADPCKRLPPAPVQRSPATSQHPSRRRGSLAERSARPGQTQDDSL